MKYLIYARVSPRGSDFEGETTIQMQMQYCRDYVKFHGGEVVGEFYDEFISGKTTEERPNFSRIMKELDSGKAEWDAIICYKLSRLTRSLKDGVNIFDDLLRRGKSFVSATENIDLSSPAGRAMFGMMQVFNQFEREQSAENVKNKALSTAKKGEWANGLAPFGYKRSGIRHDNVLQVDEPKAAIVRDIFSLFASGVPTKDIVKKYRGILVKSQIMKIRLNPTYLGKIVHTGKIFEGKHPAIISNEIFMKAQPVGSAAETTARTGAYKHYHFLLSGLIRCNCGSPLVAGTAKSGRYAYYTCSNIDCRRRLSAPKIEKYALDFIHGIKTDEETIAGTVAELKQQAAEQKEKYRPDVERLTVSREKLETEKKRLLDILLGNDLHKGFVEELNARMSALQTQIEAIDSEFNAVKSMYYDESGVYEVAMSFVQKIRTMQDALINVPQESLQAACQLHIKRIELLPDGENWHIVPAYEESSDKSPEWWAMTDSNRRHSRCKRDALTN